MASKPKKRKTQSERRSETQAILLQSACKLFGRKGYAGTSLEDIANECGLTTSPVYHYYGNKKQLFNAATEHMESKLSNAICRVVDSSDKPDAYAMWNAFLETCKNDEFRQIVLVDAPNILGRERWRQCSAFVEVSKILQKYELDFINGGGELMARMLLSAFAEAALMIGESGDIDNLGGQAFDVVQRLLPKP